MTLIPASSSTTPLIAGQPGHDPSVAELAVVQVGVEERRADVDATVGEDRQSFQVAGGAAAVALASELPKLVGLAEGRRVEHAGATAGGVGSDARAEGTPVCRWQLVVRFVLRARPTPRRLPNTRSPRRGASSTPRTPPGARSTELSLRHSPSASP